MNKNFVKYVLISYVEISSVNIVHTLIHYYLIKENKKKIF